MDTRKGQIARTQGLTSEVRGPSGRHVDEVPGPSSTSQVDQATSPECARNKARDGKLSSVGSGVLAVTNRCCSKQSG